MRCALLFSDCCRNALAQAGEPVVDPLEPISSPYLMKLTGGLILVVLVIFVLAWLVKKFNLNPACA